MKSFIGLISSDCYLINKWLLTGGKINFNFHSYVYGTIEISGHGKVSFKKRLFLSKNAYLGALSNGNVSIGECVYFGRNDIVCSLDSIKIGNNVSIGPNVCIYDHDHDYKNDFKHFVCSPVVIGNNVWIGCGAIILKGTVIGDGCVIAAGTVLKGQYGNNLLIRNEKGIIQTSIIRNN
jgi:acetyltransferase-like isoleucine patch superfamily enzyme